VRIIQDEVLSYLKKRKGKWLTSTQVAKGIKLSKGATIRSLNGLWLRGWIDRDVVNTKLFKYRYCPYDKYKIHHVGTK